MQKRLAVLALITASLGHWAAAQTTTATISGVVRDPQGGIIPNSSITVVQIETGQTRQTSSGATGDYTIPNLTVGTYRITASAAGFKKTVLPSITLQVNQEAHIDLLLEVGALSEEVTVTAEAPLLSTESTSVGQVVENRSVE